MRAAKAPSRERADALSSLGVAMAEINSTGYRENGDGHGDELSQARASGKMAMGERRGTREECKDVRAKMVEGRYARCSSKQKKKKTKENKTEEIEESQRAGGLDSEQHVVADRQSDRGTDPSEQLGPGALLTTSSEGIRSSGPRRPWDA